MTTANEIEVNVSEVDRITGLSEWDSILSNFKSWELTDDEINDVVNGKTVKCISPNGRRIIWITKKGMA
jgi:hypothetical protein